MTKMSSDTYTMGYSEEFQKLLRRRNAAREAAHLLPHLKPGMRILDFGCGPGTISMGLAEAITPGELHGIDMEDSQIQMARAAALAGGNHNTTFHTGNVTELPFEDNSFDVAHCHAVLMHITETERALAEVKRVLKPGGIISCREMIATASFSAPNVLDDLWTIFASLMIANRSHPNIGKSLRRVLLEAGFSDIAATASFESFSTPDDIAFFSNFTKGWVFSDHTKNAIIQHGVASQEKLDDLYSQFDVWAASPGAVAAFAWGEGLAHK